jgi:signal transduction histidine kinase
VRIVARVDRSTDALVSLEIVDTGMGIPADRLDAIFEAFQQAENSTARRFGGTGLGLSISRALCAEMGISLTVESTVGAGSTFRLTFPPEATSSAILPPKAGETSKSA